MEWRGLVGGEKKEENMSSRQIFYLRTLLLLGGVILMGVGAIQGSSFWVVIGSLGLLAAIFLNWVWWLRKFFNKE